MNNIINWLSDNKEWVFSGVGIAIVGGIIKLFRNRKTKNQDNEQLPTERNISTSTASHEGIAIGNVGGDVNIYPKKEPCNTKTNTEFSTEVLKAYTSALKDEIGSWGGLELKRDIRIEDIYVSRIVERPSDQTQEPIPEKELFQQLVTNKLPSQKIIIEGPAGCGKSTLLKNWALDLVKYPNMAVTKEYIPIWLPLGDVQSWDISIVEMATRRFPPDAEGQESLKLRTTLGKVIESGDAFILLDAADEVPQDAHHKLKVWLKETYNYAKLCPVVIASRPSDFIANTRGDTFQIEPFNQEKRELFIRRWFNTAKRSDLIDSITVKLKSTPRLNEDVLVGNPLFLTIMCIDYEYRKEIADTPGMLLEHFIHILLKFWDREKLLVGHTTFHSEIPIDLKLRILESIAAYYFERDSRIFEQRELEEHVSGLLKTLNSNVKAVNCLDEIVHRSNILVADRLGYFRFSHTLFQEFFVAKDRIEKRRIGVSQDDWLVNNFSNPRFNNIIQYYDEILAYSQTVKMNSKEL